MHRLLEGVHAQELFALHEMEELLERGLDLHRLHDVVEVRAVQRHVAAELHRDPVGQVAVEQLVEPLHQHEVVFDELRLGFLLDGLDRVELVAHFGEGVDHARVHHARVRVERLPQLGVREHHALERALVINPR